MVSSSQSKSVELARKLTRMIGATVVVVQPDFILFFTVGAYLVSLTLLSSNAGDCVLPVGRRIALIDVCEKQVADFGVDILVCFTKGVKDDSQSTVACGSERTLKLRSHVFHI
jgi:hypothetical protein